MVIHRHDFFTFKKASTFLKVEIVVFIFSKYTDAFILSEVFYFNTDSEKMGVYVIPKKCKSLLRYPLHNS